MTERAQALEAAEPWREQLDRLRQMASPDGDWDLSDNDRAAIQAAIDRAVQPPPPVGSPTTERPTKPSREVPNLMKALLKSLEPPVVEPTPEPPTEEQA